MAEQSVIGSYTICTKKQDGEAARAVFVVEFVISLQNLQESEGSGGDGGEPMSVLRSLAGMDVRRPARGNEVPLAKLESCQCVVSTEAVIGVLKF